MITQVSSNCNTLQVLFQGGELSLFWPVLAAANAKSAANSKHSAHTGPAPYTKFYLHYDLCVFSGFVSVVYNLALLCHVEKKTQDGEGHSTALRARGEVCGDSRKGEGDIL